jgi:peptidoglycan/LPS O-acetylase OafA/YrhL
METKTKFKTKFKTDPIDPVASEESYESTPRRWLAWLAIPVAAAIVWFTETGVHDHWMADSMEGAFIVFGMLAGGACVVFSRPQLPGLKWALLVLYALVLFPMIGVIEIMINGIFSGRSL